MLSVKALFTEYASDHGTVVKAAQNVTFDVPEGKLFTLLGPSGCGKTTTLRSIAGLEKPTSGEIEVAGSAVYSSSRGIFVAPNKRNFGMVFQSYAIWPHMNVFQNVAFPLEVRKLGKREIQDKVMRVLTAVQLDHLVDRDATKLSGGQQQRLALARALVMEPQLLLLDEPLVQSRRQAARRHAHRAQAAAARVQPHHGLRHPRPDRGAVALARDRGDERRLHRADRHAAPDLRAARPTSSSPISSARPISSAAPSPRSRAAPAAAG